MSAAKDINGDTPSEMSCREIVDAITAYIEKTMPPAEVRRFDAHLAECSYCVAYVEQMRETIGALGRVDEETLSPEAREKLLEGFRDWRSH